MSKAFRFVFCEFATKNMEDALAYYAGFLGATQVHQAADGACYLSLGVDHHNIVLRPADAGKLLTTGFQLTPGTDVEALAKECSGQGLPCEVLRNVRPGVEELLHVEVGGHAFEFFAAMEMPAPGFREIGIVPNRLGHIALITPDAEAMVKFFRDTLGFHWTDSFEGIATFLTCNQDHHTINIIGAPITKVHHLAFEMRGAGHQYDAADKCAKAHKPIVWGPSRHTAGHNYAAYHYDPDRVLIELYSDMDVYLPELGHFDPRPWHETLPLKPQVWPPDRFNAWDTDYTFDMRTA